MAAKAPLFEVLCPCCEATLKIDPETRAVISHKEKEKPHIVEDLKDAVQRLKREEARREEVFQKHVDAQKTHKDVLARKFDELFKQAKENPDTGPFKKEIDLD
jgi:predicted nuclease with TOPRIM domain